MVGRKTWTLSGLSENFHRLHQYYGEDRTLPFLREVAKEVAKGGTLSWTMLGLLGSEVKDDDDIEHIERIIHLKKMRQLRKKEPTEDDEDDEDDLLVQDERDARAFELGIEMRALPEADPNEATVPRPVRHMVDTAVTCPHRGCKLGMLALTLAALRVKGQSAEQLLNNLNLLGDITSTLALSYLASVTRSRVSNQAAVFHPAVSTSTIPSHFVSAAGEVDTDLQSTLTSFHKDEAEEVLHVIRQYSFSDAFRARFVHGKGLFLLLSLLTPQKGGWCSSFSSRAQHVPLSTKVTGDPCLVVPVLSIIRTMAALEASTDDLGCAPKMLGCSPERESLATSLVSDVLASPQCTTAMVVEAAALVTYLSRIGGEVQHLQHYPPLLARFLSSPSGPAATMSLKALVYLSCVAKNTIPVVLPLGVLPAMHHMVVKFGEVDVALFYIALFVERVAKHIMEGSADVSDETITQLFNIMSSVTMRLIVVVDGKPSLAGDVIGKLCHTVHALVTQPRNQVILYAHSLSHFLTKGLLNLTTLPDWTLVHVLEALDHMFKSEAPGQLLAKQLKSAPVKTTVVVGLVTRLLNRCKEQPLLCSRVTAAAIRLLVRLAPVTQNAEVIFSNVTMSNLWAWENFRYHHYKETERRVVADRIAEGRTVRRNDDLEKMETVHEVEKRIDEERSAVQRAAMARADEAQQVRAEANVDLPTALGVEFEVAILQRTHPISEALGEVERAARRLNEILFDYSFISEHRVKYDSYAVKLQTWLKGRINRRRVIKAVAERYRQNQAALTIQRTYRGMRARLQHCAALQREARRREAAIAIQKYWRSYRTRHAKQAQCMLDYVLSKLGLPLVSVADLPVPDVHQGRSVDVVDLHEETFSELVYAEGESWLVIFYDPWNAYCTLMLPTVDLVAYFLRETKSVKIGRVRKCQDNAGLLREFSVVSYPTLYWIDSDNRVHNYDAEWPKTQISIATVVRTYAALQVQRFWKGVRVMRKYRDILARIREEVRVTNIKNLQKACETGDTALLNEAVEKLGPDHLLETGELPLNVAIKNGKKEAFAALLRWGAKINAVDDKGHSPAFYAAATGHHELLRLLIKRGVDLHHRDSQGKTLLHVACEAGKESIALLLINTGLDEECFARDRHKHTPLDYAILGGLESVAKQLMVKGVLIHRKIERLMLFHVLLKGMQEIALLIAGQGLVDLDLHDGTEEMWTPLHYAAAMGLHNVVAALLEKQVRLTPRNSSGQIPLHLAAKNGHSTCCEHLLSAMQRVLRLTLCELLLTAQGMDGKVQGEYVDKFGNTVLHYACGHEKLAKFAESLVVNLEAGAHLPGANHEGNTCLHYACAKGHYFVTLKLVERLMLTDSSLIDLANNAGNTPLHLAVSSGYREITGMMLRKGGADITIADPAGNSLLHFASARVPESLSLVQLLLREFAHPPDICNEDGLTPLHVACVQGHLSVSQEICMVAPLRDKLVRYLNLMDSRGNTALHYACAHSKRNPDVEQLVVYLIVEGADPTIANADGLTAYNLVHDKGVVKEALILRKQREENEELEGE